MKFAKIIIPLSVILFLAGCGSNTATASADQNIEMQESSSASEVISTKLEESSSPESDDKTGNILITYFSLGEHFESPENLDAVTSASLLLWDDELTGNAGVIARMIQSHIGGDLFSIQVDKKYPGDTDIVLDLGLQEQRRDERPALTSQIANLENYDTIFLVYPTWWYRMPMAVYSFFDEYDFSGKTIYVVNTSSGSRFVKEISTIQNLEPDATVIEGIALIQDKTLESEDELTDWLDTLDITTN